MIVRVGAATYIRPRIRIQKKTRKVKSREPLLSVGASRGLLASCLFMELKKQKVLKKNATKAGVKLD